MLAAALLALFLQQAEAAPATPPSPPAPPAPTAPSSPAPPRAAAKRPQQQSAEEPILVGFDRKSGKRFTGDFADEDVSAALKKIADAGDWSIVLPPGEHGTISAHFKGAPVEEALRAVLAQSGLTAERTGSVVTIRARSLLPGLPGLTGLGRDVERDVHRATDQAIRQSEKASRAAERELRRAERQLRREMRSEHGDKVVRGDVVVRADHPARDVVAIRGSIKIEPGAEVRDAVALLGNVVLEPGAHAREAVAVGGDVKLGAGAQVEKDVVSVAGSISRDEGAEIGGDEVSVGVPALSGLAGLIGARMAAGRPESTALTVGQVLAKFAVYFVLGLVVLALFPRRVDAVATSFRAHPWKAVFTGLLGLVALPVVCVLLVATLIGIPLLPVAALLVVAAGILGFTALAHHVGAALPLRIERRTSALQLALGTAIVVLVTSIPLVGWMAWAAAALLAFGAVLRSRFGSQLPGVLPTTPAPPAAPPAATPPA